MRVITGISRGRRLITLEGDEVRPTTDKVKESLFNIIQFDVEGCSFLDLFSGSGQIGIEALSRGARKATFVDKSKSSISVTEKNIAACGFQNDAVTVNSDSISFLFRRNEKYDIAFLDPPYSTGLLERALSLIPSVMNENGIIICECPAGDELPDGTGLFKKHREYNYGKLKLVSYMIPED